MVLLVIQSIVDLSRRLVCVSARPQTDFFYAHDTIFVLFFVLISVFLFVFLFAFLFLFFCSCFSLLVSNQSISYLWALRLFYSNKLQVATLSSHVRVVVVVVVRGSWSWSKKLTAAMQNRKLCVCTVLVVFLSRLTYFFLGLAPRKSPSVCCCCFCCCTAALTGSLHAIPA